MEEASLDGVGQQRGFARESLGEPSKLLSCGISGSQQESYNIQGKLTQPKNLRAA